MITFELLLAVLSLVAAIQHLLAVWLRWLPPGELGNSFPSSPTMWPILAVRAFLADRYVPATTNGSRCPERDATGRLGMGQGRGDYCCAVDLESLDVSLLPPVLPGPNVLRSAGQLLVNLVDAALPSCYLPTAFPIP